MVWHEEQPSRCPECGTWEWEWTESETAWTADTWRCHGCEQRDMLTRQVAAQDEYAPPGDSDGKKIGLFRHYREETHGQ